MKLTLKAARVNASISQHEAAKRLNISPSTLCAYEGGKTVPRHDKLLEMVGIYGVTVNDITFARHSG